MERQQGSCHAEGSFSPEASPEDVGNAAVFLCTDVSAHTTGEVFQVDSGTNILGVTEPWQKV